MGEYLMRVLVACEESQAVTLAFRAFGHEAFSSDLQECSGGHPEWHIQGDVLDVLDDGWNMMIAHPECKYLCLSSAGWFYHPDDKHLANEDKRPHPNYPDRMDRFHDAVEFFLKLKNADIPKICIENSEPLGRTIQRVGRYTQVVQPWWFGDAYTKGAYLWLKGLCPLEATHTKPDKIEPYSANLPPGPERSKLRAKTYQGIANAFATQWGTDWKRPGIMEQAI